MIELAEALRRLADVAHPLGVEKASLADAHRRVLAEPMTALVRAPAQDVSAMDGYAVRDEDLAPALARLPVAGTSFAGQPHGAPLGAGTCVRIFTGAALPAGADRVVIQENVERDGEVALFRSAPGSARHIRRAGSDFELGEVLLQAGTRLGPRQLVAAAAADRASVPVWRAPRLIVIGTGDELVPPGQTREQSNSIPESISLGIMALSVEWGAEPLERIILPDQITIMRASAAGALTRADVVVVTGGASVGERDHAKDMFADLELIFSKVAIKPGKPVWLGRAGGRIVLGLPGNPTSAMVTARLFLAPLVAGLTGRDPAIALQWRSSRLADAQPSVGPRETFARGVERDAGAVHILRNQDSSAQKTLAEATLLVRLPSGNESLPPGMRVDTLAL